MPDFRSGEKAHRIGSLAFALAFSLSLALNPAGPCAFAQDAEAILRETFTRSGSEALVKGQYAEAERLLKAALIEAGKYPREYVPLTNILQKLGSCYLQEGKLSEAEPLFVRVSEVSRKYRGDESLSFADSLYNLALLHARQKDLPQAKSDLTRALEIYQKNATQDDLAKADTAWGLALIAFQQDQFADCEANLKTAIGLYDKIRGEENADFVDGIVLLSRVYCHDGKYELSEKLLRRGLELDEQLRGKSDPAVAADLCLSATLSEKQNQLTQAAASLERAVAIFNQLAAGDQLAASTAAKASGPGKGVIEPPSRFALRNDAERAKAAGAETTGSPRSLDKIEPPAAVKPFEAMRSYAAVLRKLGREPEAKKLESQARAAEKRSLTKK